MASPQRSHSTKGSLISGAFKRMTPYVNIPAQNCRAGSGDSAYVSTKGRPSDGFDSAECASSSVDSGYRSSQDSLYHWTPSTKSTMSPGKPLHVSEYEDNSQYDEKAHMSKDKWRSIPMQPAGVSGADIFLSEGPFGGLGMWAANRSKPSFSKRVQLQIDCNKDTFEGSENFLNVVEQPDVQSRTGSLSPSGTCFPQDAVCRHGGLSCAQDLSPEPDQLRTRKILRSEIPSIHNLLGSDSKTRDNNIAHSGDFTIYEETECNRSLLPERDSTEPQDDTGTEISFSSGSTDQDVSVVNHEDVDRSRSRKLVVDRLVRYFGSLQAIQPLQIPTASTEPHEDVSDACQPTKSSSSTEASGHSEHTDVNCRQPQKRVRGTGGEDGGHDEDDEGNGRRRKRSKKKDDNSDRTQLEAQRRLACPYYKRSPLKYRNQKYCPGPGWENVHRLKSEHLLKFHFKLRCQRCGGRFANDGSLEAHTLMNPACTTIRPLPQVDEFDQKQRKLILSRRDFSGDLTEEVKWRKIYRILFPNDDQRNEPTPYYDDLDSFSPEDIAFYQTYAQQEFDRRLFQVLNRRFSQDERLRQEFQAITSNVWNSLPSFREWALGRVSQPSADNASSLSFSNFSVDTDIEFDYTSQSNRADASGATHQIETSRRGSHSVQLRELSSAESIAGIVTHLASEHPQIPSITGPSIIAGEWLAAHASPPWAPTSATNPNDGETFSNETSFAEQTTNFPGMDLGAGEQWTDVPLALATYADDIDDRLKSMLAPQSFSAYSDSGFVSDIPNHSAGSPSKRTSENAAVSQSGLSEWWQNPGHAHFDNGGSDSG